MLNLNLNECKSVENLTKKHEKEWLKEYMQFLEDHTMWDTSFIDFLHYKIFLFLEEIRELFLNFHYQFLLELILI